MPSSFPHLNTACQERDSIEWREEVIVKKLSRMSEWEERLKFVPQIRNKERLQTMQWLNV